MTDRRLVSQAEAARELGVTRQYIGKLVAKGRLELAEGKIDLDQARQIMLHAADLTQSMRDTVASRLAQKNIALLPGADLSNPLEKYNKAKAEREHWASRLEHLDYLERVQALIAADAARLAVKTLAVQTVAALLRIPDRIAPILAAETHPARIHEMLTAEIEQTCAHIAEASATLTTGPAAGPDPESEPD